MIAGSEAMYGATGVHTASAPAADASRGRAGVIVAEGTKSFAHVLRESADGEAPTGGATGASPLKSIGGVEDPVVGAKVGVEPVTVAAGGDVPQKNGSAGAPLSGLKNEEAPAVPKMPVDTSVETKAVAKSAKHTSGGTGEASSVAVEAKVVDAGVVVGTSDVKQVGIVTETPVVAVGVVKNGGNANAVGKDVTKAVKGVAGPVVGSLVPVGGVAGGESDSPVSEAKSAVVVAPMLGQTVGARSGVVDGAAVVGSQAVGASVQVAGLPGGATVRSMHDGAAGVAVAGGGVHRGEANELTVRSYEAATPNKLEVGLQGGGLGWLKVRAEMGNGGEVNAFLRGSSADSIAVLRAQAPKIEAYLGTQDVAVRSVRVETGLVSQSAMGSGVSSETGGFGGKSSQERRGSSESGSPRATSVMSDEGPVVETVNSQIFAGQASVRLSGTGSWLSVRA